LRCICGICRSKSSVYLYFAAVTCRISSYMEVILFYFTFLVTFIWWEIWNVKLPIVLRRYLMKHFVCSLVKNFIRGVLRQVIHNNFSVVSKQGPSVVSWKGGGPSRFIWSTDLITVLCYKFLQYITLFRVSHFDNVAWMMKLPIEFLIKIILLYLFMNILNI